MTQINTHRKINTIFDHPWPMGAAPHLGPNAPNARRAQGARARARLKGGSALEQTTAPREFRRSEVARLVTPRPLGSRATPRGAQPIIMTATAMLQTLLARWECQGDRAPPSAPERPRTRPQAPWRRGAAP